MEETTTVETSAERLSKRREQLLTTLRHIESEHKEVEQNIDWIDQAAYESRVVLLDELNRGYLAEIPQIDKALERIDKQEYGNCAACHKPIDPKRLQATPATEYCAPCAKFREEFDQNEK